MNQLGDQWFKGAPYICWFHIPSPRFIVAIAFKWYKFPSHLSTNAQLNDFTKLVMMWKKSASDSCRNQKSKAKGKD